MGLFSKLLDLLVPPKCEICGATSKGGVLCEDCRKKFVRECFEHCPICGMTAQNCVCGADFTEVTGTELGGAHFFSLTFYRSESKYGKDERVTEQLIYSLKESGRPSGFFAEEMSRGLKALFARAGEDPSEWTITYPPRSSAKFYKNGFDQSEITAEKLARLLGCRTEKTLIRGGRSAEQKTLDSQSRHENAESTLVTIRRNIKQGGKYLLLDDIITSGATVEAAAKLLYSCGAAEVFPISICRTMAGERGK